MKRLIEKDLMFGTLIGPPPTLTLPTRGRGGVGSVRLGAALVVLSLPSPSWGGLGWGASVKQTVP